MKSKTDCPTCGDTFSSELGVKQHHAKSHGESISGEPVDCDNCGTTVRKKPNLVKKWDSHFCGDECRFEYTSGENHHQYERVKVTCSNCGKEIEKRPSRLRGQKHHFCDYSCRDKFYQESGMFSGEDNPSWKGGKLEPYGCGWRPLRNSIVSEDGECQACGSDNSLLAHHIKPVRSFDKEADAHYRENLVTLCRTCHPTYECMDTEEQVERLNVPRLEIEV